MRRNDWLRCFKHGSLEAAKMTLHFGNVDVFKDKSCVNLHAAHKDRGGDAVTPSSSVFRLMGSEHEKSVCHVSQLTEDQSGGWDAAVWYEVLQG